MKRLLFICVVVLGMASAGWAQQSTVGLSAAFGTTNILDAPQTASNINWTNAVFTATVAGDATANGTYRFKQFADSQRIVLTNASGSADWLFYNIHSNAVLAGLGSSVAIITNSSIPDAGGFDGVMYESSTGGGPWTSGNWVQDNGGGSMTAGLFTSPLATLVTNSYTVAKSRTRDTLTGMPFSVFSNATVYVDPVNGSDILGTVGTIPFRTVTAAAAVAKTNYVIKLSKGWHVTGGSVTIPTGCSVVGSGAGDTYLYLGDPATVIAKLTMTGPYRFSDLTLYGVFESLGGASNVVESVYQKGEIDGAFVSMGANESMYVHNSRFSSASDAFLLTGTSSARLYFYNTLLEANHDLPNALNAGRCFSATAGRVFFYGCTLVNRNFNAAVGTCLEVGGNTAIYELFNTSLMASSTNGAAYQVVGINSGANQANVTNYNTVIPGGAISAQTVTQIGGGVWRKEVIYGSATTNGAATAASVFLCNLYGDNAPWPASGMTNSALRPLPQYGYISNLTFGFVGPPIAATTNIAFTIRTNVLKSGAVPGTVAAGLKGTLLGGATADLRTNISGIADTLIADEHALLEIVPSAIPIGVTNFWWRVEHWFQDN